MKTGMTTVSTFNDLDKAEEVKALLVKEGVRAEVVDESNYQRFLFLSHPLACDKVYVADEDFAKAQEVLKVARAQEEVLRFEVRCPKCESADVDYPQCTRKFFTTAFVQIFSLLHAFDKQFYCNSCHHTWPSKEYIRYKTDLLNWPKREKGFVARER
jgi:hypothetical protein